MTEQQINFKIPIGEAEKLIRKYGADQVIIVSTKRLDDGTWVTCVTTDGSNIDQKDLAAQGGNWVKKALGWPNELTVTKSKMVLALERKITRLHTLIRKLQHQLNPLARM